MKWTWALLVAALFAAVAFSGCMGQDGEIKGSIWWPSGYGMVTYQLHSTGGFPTTVDKGEEYDVDEGSYYFGYYLYRLSDNYAYSTYRVDYSVKANKGEFLKDGEDKHFEIDCYNDDYEVTGTNIVMKSKSVNPETGESIKAYSNGAYTITVRVKKTNEFSSGKAVKQNG
jgi:hypothetical protein